jgi:hypothetical protein
VKEPRSRFIQQGNASLSNSDCNDEDESGASDAGSLIVSRLGYSTVSMNNNMGSLSKSLPVVGKEPNSSCAHI